MWESMRRYVVETPALREASGTLKTAEVAALLGVSQPQVMRWVREGLPHSRRRRWVLVDTDALRAWLAQGTAYVIVVKPPPVEECDEVEYERRRAAVLELYAMWRVR